MRIKISLLSKIKVEEHFKVQKVHFFYKLPYTKRLVKVNNLILRYHVINKFVKYLMKWKRVPYKK